MSIKSRLANLIVDVLNNKIQVVEFCDNFEILFNLEINKDELDYNDLLCFSRLFDVIVWYSPFPEERATIPNYVDENEVLRAVREAALSLGLG